MRVIVAIIAAAALGWTGWWFFLASAKETAIRDWLEARRAAGWVAEAQDIRVAGFPYRVDTTVTELDLANPQGGWAWTATEFQFLTLAYQPHHLIAIWPPAQTISTPWGSAEVTAALLRASLVVSPDPSLALDRATLETRDLAVALPAGLTLRAPEAVLSVRRAEGEHAYDVGLDADGLALPEEALAFEPTGALGAVIERLRLDATARFDRALDRGAVEETPPRLETLAVRDVSLVWGRLDLRGQGELRADVEGFAEGRLDLRARNWRDMLDLAETSGALSSGTASALRGGLGLLAQLGGDPDTIDAPLEFRNGRAFLGPLPVGDAPRLAGPAG